MNHVIYTLESDYVEPIHRLDQRNSWFYSL